MLPTGNFTPKACFAETHQYDSSFLEGFFGGSVLPCGIAKAFNLL